MKIISNVLLTIFIILTGINLAYASVHAPKIKLTDNQTLTVSPILPASGVPFTVEITQANFQLPVGFHSGVVGVYKGLWVFIAGRINGLHGFDPTNNFPPDQQNTSIYVVNPTSGAVASRSLYDATSGLTQAQIDTLSVTSPEGRQEGETLYMVGGYGADTNAGIFTTKAVLTAIYLPGIVNWVMQTGSSHNSVASNIQQIYDPTFQITGGRLYNLNGVMQLVFGQDFEGQYTDTSNGNYSEQVRRFVINQSNGKLSVTILNSMPSTPDLNFRRRDLNVLPTLLFNSNHLMEYALTVFSGVFTLSGGVWTVPVLINGIDDPVMADPSAVTTFKQGMNNYACATASFYSTKYASMYHVFFGGISYGYFSGGSFATDSEIPFINQVTTVQMDQHKNFTQYIMNNEYPYIVSTGSNPGNQLLFGAGAYFIPVPTIQRYQNAVINLDNIRKPTVIGYIVGGIQSTLANTNTMSDSAASPYVFAVTLRPTG